MNRRILALILCFGAFVASCGDDDGGTTAATTSTVPTEDDTGPDDTRSDDTGSEDTDLDDADDPAEEDPAGGAAVVEVLDAGSEPRVQLAFSAPVGTVDRVVQVQETRLEQELGGQTQTIVAPTTESDLDVVVDEVDGDTRRLVASFAASRVLPTEGAQPEVVTETERLLGLLDGAVQTTVQTARGDVVSTSVEGLEDTQNAFVDDFLAGVQEQARAFAIPFPAEPIGPGGRWSVRSEVTLGGLPIEATYVVTVDSIEGDAVIATVEGAVSFVPGPVTVQGFAATVVSGDLTGTGEIRWDLATTLLPRLDLTLEGTAIIEADGLRLVQRQTQRTALRSR